MLLPGFRPFRFVRDLASRPRLLLSKLRTNKESTKKSGVRTRLSQIAHRIDRRWRWHEFARSRPERDPPTF